VVKVEFMKKKFLLLSKITGLFVFYMLILIASIFLTMSILIKGEEVKAPNLIGKSLKEAYTISAEKGIYLKTEIGDYGKNYKPLTVIDQFPSPDTHVKENSFIKVFINSELTEVIVPDLSGHNLKECEKLLNESDLKKGFVAYIEDKNVPVDFIISQSYASGKRVPRGTLIDLLVSKGKRDNSFMMPDIIGMEAKRVLYYFESKGLRISKITHVPYQGLPSGIIIKQFPTSGFRINQKNLISIQVSE
jgi:serine/threonine-protein kinase